MLSPFPTNNLLYPKLSYVLEVVSMYSFPLIHVLVLHIFDYYNFVVYFNFACNKSCIVGEDGYEWI